MIVHIINIIITTTITILMIMMMTMLMPRDNDDECCRTFSASLNSSSALKMPVLSIVNRNSSFTCDA